jgi:TIR domain-containing protein
MSQPIEIFCCAAEADQSSLRKLNIQLAPQQQQGVIKLWDESQIPLGARADREIRQHLASARIFLLLISPDFLADDYCNRVMNDAHRRNKLIIPVIVRPSGWESDSVLNGMQVLPRNRMAINNQPDPENALSEAANEIRAIIKQMGTSDPENDLPSAPIPDPIPKGPPPPKPRVTSLMHLLKLMVTRSGGWIFIGMLVLLTGVLWGASSPTLPYLRSSEVSDGYYYDIDPKNDALYIYAKNNTATFFIARCNDFSPHIDCTNIHGSMNLSFVALPNTISVNYTLDTNEGKQHITQAHVIEQLVLSDSSSTLRATYTVSDYNSSSAGYYENRWWPVAVALIAAGLLIASVALFVGRIRRKGASFVPST